jgi:DNA polymerase
MQRIEFDATFAGWQAAARAALQQGVAPAEAFWQTRQDEQPALALFEEEAGPASASSPVRVSRRFVDVAERVACHCDPERWAFLYRVLWRLTHGEPRLLDVAVDPDVDRLVRMDQAVRREVHRCAPSFASARCSATMVPGTSPGSSPSIPSCA